MERLARLLAEDALRRLAGDRSFERGVDYFAAGRIARLTSGDERVEAAVQGTHRYRVELWSADGELASSCTCPIGQDGAFCKHCVAVGLAVHEREGGNQETTVTLDDVRRHLASLPGEELVELLIAEAEEDERLFDRLRLRTAAGGDAVDMAAFRDAIDRAVDPGTFVPYAEAYDYARTLEEMIDSLQGLLDRGNAAEAVELIEYCCSTIEQAGGAVDDSDGHLGVVFDRVQKLYRRACERADLNPVQLAERLFELMMSSEYELFLDAIDEFAPLLGTAGRLRYAELARAEWERLPALRPNEGEDDRPPGPFLILREDADALHRRAGERQCRFRITHVMKLLAVQTGDVDELVAVLSHDLSLPYSFLRIAEVYSEAGREDDALEWAERGVEAFPDRPDPRLVTFLAEAYGRRGDHARALDLIWDLYEARPGLGSYRDLRPYAERAGRWSEVRDRALGLLRDRVSAAQEERRRRGYGWGYLDATELVRIRLWEDETEAALQDARAGGCSGEVWLELAARLEKDRPREAIAIYRDQVEPTINRKTKADYRDATQLLAKVRDLLARTGSADEFPSYLDEVRSAHRRKRNLMRLLDELDRSPEVTLDPRPVTPDELAR